MRPQFFSTQRYLQRRHDVIIPPEPARGHREWIISRGLCHYRCFSLKDIPVNRREPVLQLQIQQWSPFLEYGSYMVWQGEQAQVWIWDKVIQQNRWLEMGIKKATLLPETVLQPRPTTETTQLLQCIEGYEGQIWQQGVLVGSRWWSNNPSLAEWLLFQRAQGLAAHSQLPTLVATPLLNRPWGRAPHRFNKLRFLYQESTWIMASAAIMSVILTGQSVSIIKWQQAVNQIQQQIDTLNEQVTPILSARTQALANRQRFEQLLALSAAQPLQLELMAKVAEKLPKKNLVRFVNWSYQLKELRFTIEADEQIDPTQYIKTFQSLPFLTEVKVDTFTDPKKLILKMRVEPSKL